MDKDSLNKYWTFHYRQVWHTFGSKNANKKIFWRMSFFPKITLAMNEGEGSSTKSEQHWIL